MNRQLRLMLISAGLFAFGFGSGIAIERTGHNPIPAAVPTIGDKPTRSVIAQNGQPSCDLYKRYPSGRAFKKDEGCPVAIGKGFRSGFHTIRDGWTVKHDVVTMVIVNENSGPIAGYFDNFHLNRYDSSLIEILWCKTEPFKAGESRAVSCRPLSPGPKPETVDNVSIT